MTMRMLPAALLGVSAAALLLGVACGGPADDADLSGDDASATTVTSSGHPSGEDAAVAVDGGSCPDIPVLFAQTCSAPACHSATTKTLGLDLQSPNLAARLVGTCAAEGSGTLLDPSNPPASVIYTKLTSTPPFGNEMPLALPPLDEATVACVLSWVSAQSGAEDTCDAGAGAGAGEGDDAGRDDAGDEDAAPKDGGKKTEDAGVDSGKKDGGKK